MTAETRHIVSLLVENEFGSLSRIAGLFSARGYNIHCLSVAPTSDDSISRMTLVTYCSDAKASQLMKQLDKLVDVINVKDLTGETHIEKKHERAKSQEEKNAEKNYYEILKHTQITLLEIILSLIFGIIIGAIFTILISTSKNLKRCIMPILL